MFGSSGRSITTCHVLSTDTPADTMSSSGTSCAALAHDRMAYSSADAAGPLGGNLLAGQILDILTSVHETGSRL